MYTCMRRGGFLTRSRDSISTCESHNITRPAKAVFYCPQEGVSAPLADPPKGLKLKEERIRHFLYVNL